MNILTFDIEEWFQEKAYFGNHSERYKQYDLYLDRILETLDKQGFKATFFCLGGMATEFPDVVKKISGNGHEIGCHSFKHVWLNKMSREEWKEDTIIIRCSCSVLRYQKGGNSRKKLCNRLEMNER